MLIRDSLVTDMCMNVQVGLLWHIVTHVPLHIRFMTSITANRKWRHVNVCSSGLTAVLYSILTRGNIIHNTQRGVVNRSVITRMHTNTHTHLRYSKLLVLLISLLLLISQPLYLMFSMKSFQLINILLLTRGATRRQQSNNELFPFSSNSGVRLSSINIIIRIIFRLWAAEVYKTTIKTQ